MGTEIQILVLMMHRKHSEPPSHFSSFIPSALLNEVSKGESFVGPFLTTYSILIWGHLEKNTKHKDSTNTTAFQKKNSLAKDNATFRNIGKEPPPLPQVDPLESASHLS